MSIAKKDKQKNISNKASEEKAASKEKRKTPAVFYLIMVLIPILFFILLETGLRIFNYGVNTAQWVPAGANKLVLNPEIARRYFFSSRNVPVSNQDFFDKVKAGNSFRVFVLGESSAAGYPYQPTGSFSRFLQKRLELAYPSQKIEVVNISMTAINTYALRDMFPGVLEQKPDLVLIYTGHNEYYGALGVGSMESIGSNPAVVNFILKLNRYKTAELLRNILASLAGTFREKEQSSGTLMSRIVKDQYIVYGSDQYKAGLKQFESNMRDILQMAKDNNVPVILGTLTSNLKDQAPFVSVKTNTGKDASQVFLHAKKELDSGKPESAEALYRLAKDLDALRFRAPEAINSIIRELAGKFSYPIAEIDSAFNVASSGGIVGNNLMTDHLHPSIKGYEMMGKLLYETMRKSKQLPKVNSAQLRDSQLDSLTKINVKFSRLDSTIADYRIRMLKNDWPFIDPKFKKPANEVIKPIDYIDSLAFRVFSGSTDWEQAHRMAANWYLSKKDFPGFKEQIDILISEYPLISAYYDMAADIFLKLHDYENAYEYLQKGFEIKPDAFSSKWLGIIELSRQRTDRAIDFLNTSLKYNSYDAQVLYNLSGAYINKEEYSKALETINRCLEIEPNFQEARHLKNQLASVILQKK